MIFQTTTRISIELRATVEAEHDSTRCWTARTVEVGRDELRLSCDLRGCLEAPRNGCCFAVIIEMPADEGARGYLRCRTELVSTEWAEANCLLLRMRVHAMKLESSTAEQRSFDAPATRVM